MGLLFIQGTPFPNDLNPLPNFSWPASADQIWKIVVIKWLASTIKQSYHVVDLKQLGRDAISRQEIEQLTSDLCSILLLFHPC